MVWCGRTSRPKLHLRKEVDRCRSVRRWVERPWAAASYIAQYGKSHGKYEDREMARSMEKREKEQIRYASAYIIFLTKRLAHVYIYIYIYISTRVNVYIHLIHVHKMKIPTHTHECTYTDCRSKKTIRSSTSAADPTVWQFWNSFKALWLPAAEPLKHETGATIEAAMYSWDTNQAMRCILYSLLLVSTTGRRASS